MPFPFVLPTTSAFSFSTSFACESHPSLPLTASTYRGVVRDTLKKHKRLHPSSQTANLSLVISSLDVYLPYLFALDAGLGRTVVNGEEINVLLKAAPSFEWRPTLSDVRLPGKENARVKVQSLEYEIAFTLSTLANSYTLQARTALQPLYTTSITPPSADQRQAAITSAYRLLLDAASVYKLLAARAEQIPHGSACPCPCADISAPALGAQGALALAEATLLSVLKDDPYPAAVAQDRNKLDREWMYKAPDLPKVRALLFGRLCLAASEHCALAVSQCQAARGASGKLSETYLRYVEDLRRASRAKACRFFALHDEIEGQTGKAIGWLHAGLQELGVKVKEEKKGLSLSKLKKDWSEKREDRKVEKGATWGSDGGKAEEARVIESLAAKWTKENDTMNTQPIHSAGSLLTQMPSGRDIHTVTAYEPRMLDPGVLETMRGLPEQPDDFGDASSSDDDDAGLSDTTALPGTFPNSEAEHTGRSSYY